MGSSIMTAVGALCSVIAAYKLGGQDWAGLALGVSMLVWGAAETISDRLKDLTK